MESLGEWLMKAKAVGGPAKDFQRVTMHQLKACTMRKKLEIIFKVKFFSCEFSESLKIMHKVREELV